MFPLLTSGIEQECRPFLKVDIEEFELEVVRSC
jgi:hypothetical protein